MNRPGSSLTTWNFCFARESTSDFCFGSGLRVVECSDGRLAMDTGEAMTDFRTEFLRGQDVHTLDRRHRTRRTIPGS